MRADVLHRAHHKVDLGKARLVAGAAAEVGADRRLELALVVVEHREQRIEPPAALGIVWKRRLAPGPLHALERVTQCFLDGRAGVVGGRGGSRLERVRGYAWFTSKISAAPIDMQLQNNGAWKAFSSTA